MAKSKKSIRQATRNFTPSLWVLGSLLVLSFILAWVSSSFENISSWLSFAFVLTLCSLFFWLTWRALQQEKPPRWLLYLTIGAALFRLVLGVVWFVALPAEGYDTEVQNAGYVMEDAFNRDRAAFELAQSQQPLIDALRGYSVTDQYGGLLFLSAGIYRYLGGAEHQPLLVLTLAAAVSGLAVAFTWAFARRAWGERVALLAAWGLALYPEAALLGSSQMREAFTVCFVPMALFGLQRLMKKIDRTGILLLIIPIAAAALLTWPFVFSLILLLVLAYLALDKWRLLRDRRLWFAAGFVAVIGVIYLAFSADIAQLWLVQSARWQAYVSANASGWVAREFERMPLWQQLPSLMIYGIFRPLLPAALIAGGPPIWAAIGIWRALGWTILLAFLVYATYLALRSAAWTQLPGALLLSSWIISLTASYRGGGDLWDNPRYRSAFAAIQVAVAAWAWVRHAEAKDPWLRRAFGFGLLLIAWFIPWYLRRYVGLEWWPIVELYQIIGLGLVSVSLYVIWDWIRS
jgi:hypothetical protein